MRKIKKMEYYKMDHLISKKKYNKLFGKKLSMGYMRHGLEQKKPIKISNLHNLCLKINKFIMKIILHKNYLDSEELKKMPSN